MAWDRLRAWVTVVCFVAALGGARSATAQDSAAADALFQEAKELVAAGKVAEACPKFQASLELQRTLGTLMNLADCLEQTGKLASAHARWSEAVRFAEELKDERVTFATQRRDALGPYVPKLVLEVTSGPEELAVRVGGAQVPASKYGLPLDVDPGALTVEVVRGDEVLDKSEMQVQEGENRLALNLAEIARKHPPKKAKKPAPPPRTEQRIAGFVVLGVGLAGVTTFAVLESVALAKRAEADSTGGCIDKGDTAVCSPQGYELVEEAGLLAEVGQWMGIGGAATVGVGLTLVLTAPIGAPDEEGDEPPAPKTAVAPWLSPHGAGVTVGGTW